MIYKVKSIAPNKESLVLRLNNIHMVKLPLHRKDLHWLGLGKEMRILDHDHTDSTPR